MMRLRILFFPGFVRYLLMVVFLTLVCSGSLRAEEAPANDVAARLKLLEERVKQLEAELEALRAAQGSVAAATPSPVAPTVTTAPAPEGAPGGPSGQLPVYGGASALAKIFNPDIGVIGNFTGAIGRNRIDPFPALSLQESEVSFRAVVDPYARADFFLSFGEEGVEVEEGYLTFTSLPGAFLVKVGKMRSHFGVINTLHDHSLSWIDRPLATENLLGGDEGIADAGLSVSRLLPAPGDIFLEATAEVFRGDSGDVFASSRRSDASVVGHLRGYKDLTESTNLDLGFSYARGHNELGSDFLTRLFGLNATLRWKPLRRAIYHSFIARSEITWSRREDLLGPQRSVGYFAAADYQLGRRWFLGGRYDWSERAQNAAEHDSGGSVLLTYWPSEFSQLRGQLRRTRYTEGTTANEFLLQLLFIIGAHGAHPF